MADYFLHTVIQQPIPVADMTPLERLVLEAMFQSDVIDDTIYFYHEQGPSDMIWLTREDLAAAFAVSPQDGALGDLVAASILTAPPNNSEIEIDLSAISWECILQDIVKRSTTLRYLTVVKSYNCSSMRADGFGGLAVIVTPTGIKGKSTDDILEEFVGEIESQLRATTALPTQEAHHEHP